MSFLFTRSQASAASSTPPRSLSRSSILSLLSSPTSSSSSATQERTDEVVLAMKMVPGMLDARTIEMELLIPCMVKLVASNNAAIKAMACEFLCRASAEPGSGKKPLGEYSDPEVGLLAVNTLNRDLKDPNPAIRAIAVSTICSLQVLADQYASDAIDLALKDSNPKVRKSGVTGCGKVFMHSPEVALNLVDCLYAQIKDRDPVVVAFAMQTVNHILKEEGGIIITNSMAKYLSGRLSDFPAPEMCFVLDYLREHYASKRKISGSLKGDDLRLHLLNVLDPYLDSKDGNVFLAAGRLFLVIVVQSFEKEESEDQQQLLRDFVKRIRPQLGKFMKPTSQPQAQDFQVEALRHLVREVTPSALLHVSKELARDLSISSKDLDALKREKISTLSYLFEDGNNGGWKSILDYFLSLLKPECSLRSTLVLESCNLLKGREDKKTQCEKFVRQLKDHVSKEPQEFSALLLEHARRLPRDQDIDPELSETLETACKFAILNCSSIGEIQLRNVLWTLRTFAGLITSSPYLLEKLIVTSNGKKSYFSPIIVEHRLQRDLLFAAVTIFAKRPAETQHTLGQIFQAFSSTGDNEAFQRAQAYAKALDKQQFFSALLSCE